MEQEQKASALEYQFVQGDRVAIAGGAVDSTGVIQTAVTICTVEQVGEKDLLVRFDRSSSGAQIIPKSICTPIKFDAVTLSTSQVLRPQLGDMVYYKGKVNWRDKDETAIAGTVYEIKFREGKPVSANVHTGTGMQDLPYDQLMVLQTKST